MGGTGRYADDEPDPPMLYDYTGYEQKAYALKLPAISGGRLGLLGLFMFEFSRLLAFERLAYQHHAARTGA